MTAASRRDRVSCRSRPFLLALSAFWPLPLVNVIPGAIIVLIAIAYLQEDGLLLAVAAAAAFLSLEDFGWTLWRSGGAVMRWIGHSCRPRTAAPMRSPLPSSRKGRS